MQETDFRSLEARGYEWFEQLSTGRCCIDRRERSKEFICLPLCLDPKSLLTGLWSTRMGRIGRRFKQTTSPKDRLSLFASELREKASHLRPGPEKDALLTRARRADTASHLSDWANSPGLQPPT